MLCAGGLLELCGFLLFQCSLFRDLELTCSHLPDLLHEHFVCLSAVCGAVASVCRHRGVVQMEYLMLCLHSLFP